jgi:hypothetical protein
MNRTRIITAIAACALALLWAMPVMAGGKTVITVGTHHRSHIHHPDRGVHCKAGHHPRFVHHHRVYHFRGPCQPCRPWGYRHNCERRCRPDCRPRVHRYQPFVIHFGFRF